MSLIPFSYWSGANIVSLSTGLKGARFVGYFADDPTWFSTATPHGDVQNNVTSISSFSSNADNYSWVWYGYFLAPTTGNYTFYTTSDDASYIWLGTNALSPTTANSLVNNGGLHAARERSGIITLNADTYYAMLIMFGESGGADIMTVNFEGPGITKTTNGSGYYFGGQESYAGNWIAGVVPRYEEEEEEEGPPPSGIVTTDLIAHFDARDTNSYPGTGNIWYDLQDNSDASLNITGLWNSNGYMAFTDVSNSNADFTLVGINSSTPVLTIEMWAKVYSISGEGMLFGFTTYDFNVSGTNTGFNTASGDQRGMTSNQNLNALWGRWCHLVFVMHQTTSYTNNKIYIDGTEIYNISQISGSENTGNRTFGTGNMRINGWRTNSSYPHQQDISIFRVYKKELTQAEVWQNYNADRSHSLFNKPALKNVVPDGLRMYLDMEGVNDWFASTGSYVKDYSGYSLFATAFAGSGWDSGSGGHYQFRNGTTRYFNINRTAGSGGFGLAYGSASFVFVVRSLDQGFLEYIFHPTNARAFQSDVNISIGGAKVTYSHNSANRPDTFSTFGAMSSNVWYHVVMTYNYNTFTVQIYVNGTLYTTGSQERMIDGTDGYYIGRDTGIYFTFDLGLFMIYNRVISSSEVTTIFNSQKDRFGL